MAYHKVVELIPIEKREKLSIKLVDIVLKSKNDDKMPSNLAKNILHYWREGPLLNENNLTALLDAAILLEPEKTVDFLGQELQLIEVVRQLSKFLLKHERPV